MQTHDSRFAVRWAAAALLYAATGAAQATLPQMTPWHYRDDGLLLWERNRWNEDNANTEFVLARNIVDVPGQPVPHDDILLFNSAQFVPAEGETAAPGMRRLALDSVRYKGLQLYVNYSRAEIEIGQGDLYDRGMFFISLPPETLNEQPEPPVPPIAFSGISISATRGAFGTIVRNGVLEEALYVTASIGYARDDIHVDDRPLADEVTADRLFVNEAGTWTDRSDLLPVALGVGNSSGVAFADFDGDGSDELYIGRQGDNFTGDHDILLDFVGGQFVDISASITGPAYAGATNEVAAADIDADGDLDIAVANRSPRDPAASPANSNLVLFNDGVGGFTRVIVERAGLDSRSVAIGDIDEATNGRLEIVFGNAGSDGFSTESIIPADQDDRMQILELTQTNPIAFSDETIGKYIQNDLLESEWTSGLTFQVLLEDIVTPGADPVHVPDGHLDLVVVNHRYLLKQGQNNTFRGEGNTVRVLGNQLDVPVQPGQPGPLLRTTANLPTSWCKSVCFANYIHDVANSNLPEPFIGTGNRFTGYLSEIIWNIPSRGWTNNGANFDTAHETTPGTERGYGFDFARTGVWGQGLDAVQTSRGYQFMTVDMLGTDTTAGHTAFWHRHWDLTHGQQVTPIAHRRGRSIPSNLEDGCFADFNGDGFKDLLVVGKRSASSSHPTPGAGAALVNVLVASDPGYSHSRSQIPLIDLATGSPTNTMVWVDDLIDINNRNATQYPGIADRVQAADMDNDGDTDAIVLLFAARDSNLEVSPIPGPVERYTYGFRYLENVIDQEGSSVWFRDIAATHMKDASGSFSPLYNRGRGDIEIADFDNNGALDLFCVQGQFADAQQGQNPDGVGTVHTVHQLQDLLFLNGIGADPVGVLREADPSMVPPNLDITLNSDGYFLDSGGGSSVDFGDVDNDGDADLLVARRSTEGGIDSYPSLLINQTVEDSGVLSFVDEYTTRVPVNDLHEIILTDTQPDQNGTPGALEGMDAAGEARFIDFDGDGDLDIFLVVGRDLLRVLVNTGVDTNNDGIIDASDNRPPGFFVDKTENVLNGYRIHRDANDSIAVDIDYDGDLDFAVDCFDDEVAFWRNDLITPATQNPPSNVTEIWPRIGAKRGTQISIVGSHLQNVSRVQFRFVAAAVDVDVTSFVLNVHDELELTLPAGMPSGLTHVRLETAPGRWSTQRMDYFVLE